MKKKKSLRPKHQIIQLIGLVPKETNIVRKEIMGLGISIDKLTRWKSDSRAYVSTEDCHKLKAYFSKFEQCQVDSIDDLFTTEINHKIAKKFNLV